MFKFSKKFPKIFNNNNRDHDIFTTVTVTDRDDHRLLKFIKVQSVTPQAGTGKLKLPVRAANPIPIVSYFVR
jgi:hypothetical protein